MTTRTSLFLPCALLLTLAGAANADPPRRPPAPRPVQQGEVFLIQGERQVPYFFVSSRSGAARGRGEEGRVPVEQVVQSVRRSPF